jgi:hypothetical protein
MPNKHKFNKILTKNLISGKLDSKDYVKDTMSYLIKKAARDNEGIDFGFDENKNTDLDRLDPNDDDVKRQKNAKGTKKELKPFGYIKPQKSNKNNEEKKEVVSKDFIVNVDKSSSTTKKTIPKKSKKNKYFFIAHPDAIKNKDDLLNDSNKDEFILDPDRIEEAKQKGKRKLDDKAATNGAKKLKKLKNKSDNNENGSHQQLDDDKKDKKTTKKEKKIPNDVKKQMALSLENIGKNFKIKKTKIRQPDGSLVVEYRPEIVNLEDNEDDNPDDNDSDHSNEDTSEPIMLEDINNDSDCISVNENETQQGDEVKSDTAKSNPSMRDKMLEKLQSSRFRYDFKVTIK